MLVRTLPIVVAAAADSRRGLPLTFLVDFALALVPSFARERGAPRPELADRTLRNALARADEVTLRLGVDPRRIDVADALAAHRGDDLARAASAVLSELCAPLADEAPLDAFDLRALARASAEELAACAARHLADEARCRALARRLDHVSTLARRRVGLLDDAAVLLAEAGPALHERHARLALAHLGHLTSELDASLPKRLTTRGRSRGVHATDSDAIHTFPTGGFAEIGPVGGFENVLPSELATLDDGVWPDVFTVRWASGELLYYLRDESVSVRRPYAVTFTLSPELERARVKHPDLPAQNVMLTIAGLIVVARRALANLGDEELSIRFALPRDHLVLEGTLLTLATASLGRRVRVERHDVVSLTRVLEDELRRGDVLEVHVGPTPPRDPRPRHLRTRPFLVSERPTSDGHHADRTASLWRTWVRAWELLARDVLEGGGDSVPKPRIHE